MVKTDISLELGYSERDLLSALTQRLGIEQREILSYRIVRQTLDYSDKSHIFYKLSVAVETSPEREAGLLKMRKKTSFYEYPTYHSPISRLTSRPVVVGAGPCGLFAALILAESGARPIVLERGLPVPQRDRVVSDFIKSGKLDKECNVQFGEGGAGTFSDGKLKVGSYDKYKMKVLSELALHGASEDILFSASAHVGTDKLKAVVVGIREKIISLGGEFVFSATLKDVKIKDSEICGVVYEKAGERIQLDCERVILATGHSARDVFSMLRSHGVQMEAKGFGIGVRIEHNREYINTLQYGKEYSKELPTASYHLVTHLQGGRSVYSFCMCPGGSVVAATSEEGGVVTNGMSEHSRDGENSNSALLVSVTKEDFASDDPLSGIELQRRIERLAYSAGGGEYKAPAERLEDFISDSEPKSLGDVTPSYPRGVALERAETYLPTYITESLRASIEDFDKWMPGFYYPDAVITGAETRSTSPVRILRDESCQAIGVVGLYPAGEGAGYAGGIVSSATDGIKCAEALLLG